MLYSVVRTALNFSPLMADRAQRTDDGLCQKSASRFGGACWPAPTLTTTLTRAVLGTAALLQALLERIQAALSLSGPRLVRLHALEGHRSPRYPIVSA